MSIRLHQQPGLIGGTRQERPAWPTQRSRPGRARGKRSGADRTSRDRWASRLQAELVATGECEPPEAKKRPESFPNPALRSCEIQLLVFDLAVQHAFLRRSDAANAATPARSRRAS